MRAFVFLVLFFVASSLQAQGFYTGAELANLTSQPDRIVVLETKQGVIKLQLFDKIAPKHVANFLQLVKSGFYDGLTFHRVIPGFMIQGGDPNSKDDDLSNDGIGKPGQKRVPAEFSTTYKHQRGILSAARTNDPNSATSQFFIMHAAAPQLDGQYSIFGQVVEGMDVVDKIVYLDQITKHNPGKASQITKAYVAKPAAVKHTKVKNAKSTPGKKN
jgi:peptidyl-prolyl cis-trans isomerase B (cyclophilin B)